jgi:hypothetical protein
MLIGTKEIKMPEEIKYPEEIKESAYESLYLRNFDKDTKRKLQHLAVVERTSVSTIVNRACKFYTKNLKIKITADTNKEK